MRHDRDDFDSLLHVLSASYRLIILLEKTHIGRKLLLETSAAFLRP